MTEVTAGDDSERNITGCKKTHQGAATAQRHASRGVHHGCCEQATHGHKQDGTDLLRLHESEM